MARSKATKKAPKTSLRKRPPSRFKQFAQQHMLPLIFIVVFAVAGGIATYLTQAGTANRYGVIKGNGGKCLDNLNGRALNHNKISLWTCDETNAQNWTLPGDGTLRNNGYCLDVSGASKIAKAVVQLYKCNGTVAQKWTAKSNGSIVNPNSGLCLDDKYSSTANGATIWMWPCNGTAAQKWTLPGTSSSGDGGTTSTPPPTTGGSTTGTSGTTVSGQAVPGTINGWKQVFVDDFTGTVPLGAFSDCNHNTDTRQAYCGGLKNYGAYYNNWWAYPNNWDDTAKSGADGNTGAPFGGTYHPEDTVSVDSGVMHVTMYRPKSGGDNHVAALVPRKCMEQKYGRYMERFRVVKADSGFKSAHLFYQGGYEIDYPENDYGDTIYAYTHPGGASFSSGAKWANGWHTTAIEWTSGSVAFYMDGRLIGTTTSKVPQIAMSWVLQNESSIMGPYAKAGATAQLDTDWVACYSKS